MNRLTYKCKLLTDVILNTKSASEGPNQTLDFIPGSTILGIVAAKLYNEENKAIAFDLFHTDKVRYGDAHPLVGNVRTLRIPAALYYPKGKKVEEGCYVSYKTDFQSEKLKKIQPKQCRTGFYDLVSNEATQVHIETNFSIKSAYDRVQRRSKDSMMYGYQSLPKGLEYVFSITTEEDNLADKIDGAIIGTHRMGRSRTAQYGLVAIEQFDYTEAESTKNAILEQVEIYADGRLIFMDEDGFPTFQPTPSQLGIDIEGAEIDLNKSQIRTFQYSPWNYKRQCFDTDRCGIEKGSVIVVTLPKGKSFTPQSTVIGNYQNEGFGQVIYCPRFLQSDENGLSVLHFSNKKIKSDEEDENIEITSHSDLIKYITRKKNQEESRGEIYKRVNEFIKEHGDDFKDARFSSQWGTIRGLAIQFDNPETLKNKLYLEEKEVIKDSRKHKVPNAYLTHGVASKKWKQRSRLDNLKIFIKDIEDQKLDLHLSIINLASEMAKYCRKENEDE